MGKRFPIPAFEYERLKDRPWTQPAYLSAQQQREVGERHGGDQWSAHHVELPADFRERFRLRGPWVHAVMCLLPAKDVLVIGRSHAWAIQQALIVDSLDAERSQVLIQWKTPRPMNTRLGPENGVPLSGHATVYVICGHRYSDYWLVNRSAIEDRTLDGRPGFSVISASDDEINDFHACNVSFSWS
jgi:hypothetical protein